MRNIFTISLLLFAQIQIFSQIEEKTGWNEQNLMQNPQKVSISIFRYAEKFGEPVEEEIGSELITFNRKGQYLEKSSINLRNKDKNETTTYQYDTNTGYLISMDYDAEYFRTADYSHKYEWENGLISKKIITIETHGTHHIEYKYDNQGKNIEEIIYDKKENISEIWRYQYDGSQLIEAKQYDNTGTLRKNKKWTYDLMKNLIEYKEFEKENNKLVLIVENKYKYNKQNDLIEEYNCNFNSYAGRNCYNKSYTYEYNPNGLIKKITEYGKNINNKSILTGIVEYKSYDDSKNWTEKLIWSDYNFDKEWKPSEKYVRVIWYY